MSSNVGIVSQARMTSTRLPGKVLKMVHGKSLLQYHLERAAKSHHKIIVATTTNETDQPIVDLCERLEVAVFRGGEMDVLKRYYDAAKAFNLQIIVRITSDCPLIDGELVGQSIEKYLSLNKSWVYMSNGLEETFPRGFDFEIFSMEMLEEANEKGLTRAEREHVTPYFYLNHHNKTQVETIRRTPDRSQFRLTVDEAPDFELVRRLLVDFNCADKNHEEITNVLLQHPELSQINAHIAQKKL